MNADRPRGDRLAPTRTEVLQASPRMFDSEVLDRLSRVHPVVPATVFGPLIAALAGWSLARADSTVIAAWMAGGYALWTLVEYWMHRVVFHFEPEDGLGARLHWIIHGVHHDHPNDPRRLVMPPAVSVPLAVAFLAAFFQLAGAVDGAALGAGFFAGYLIYDSIHFLLHHHVPHSRLGRSLRERHMRHHFQDDTRGFGISAPYWDRVFRTAARRDEGERR